MPLISDELSRLSNSGLINKGEEPQQTIVAEPKVSELKAWDGSYEFGDGCEIFMDGLKTSPIGMQIRRAWQGTFNPVSKYSPKDSEELDKWLQQTNYDMDALDIAFSGASTPEEVRKNLDLIDENRRIERKMANSPWYMSLVGGLGQMAGNPVDIATTAAAVAFPQLGVPAKLASGATKTAVVLNKAGKVAVPIAANVVAGVSSNQLQEITTGIDHDVWTDVFSITALTLGIQGVRFTGNAARKVAINHDKMIKGEEVDTTSLLGKFSKETLPAYKKINDIREQLESKLPSVELKTKLKQYMGDPSTPKLREFVSSITDFEEGLRSRGNRNFAKINRTEQAVEQRGGITYPEDSGQKTLAYGSGKTTLMEEVEGFRVDDNRLMDSITNKVSNVSTAFGRDKVNDFLYRKIAGKDTSSFGKAMNSNKDLAELAVTIGKAYEKRGYQLVNHDLVDNIFSFGKYLPMIVDRAKITKYVGRFGFGKEAVATARARLSTNLYNGVLNDKETYDNFLQIFREEMAATPEAKGLASLDQKKLSKSQKVKNERMEQEAFLQWLSKKADDSAFGYMDQNTSRGENFDRSGSNVNFQKRRMPWNTSYVDAEGFSVNSLRMDLVDATRAYFNTSTGLLATKRVYGADYEGMKNIINDLGNEFRVSKNLKEGTKAEVVDELNAILNRAYGRAISDRDYGVSDAISAIGRHLTYGAYSTLMGVLNYGEVAQALRAYGLKFMLQALPGTREVFERFFNKDLSKADRRYIQDYLQGREVLKLMSVREIIRSNQEMYRATNPYLATAVGISQVLAEYSPGNLVMRYSNDSIIDAVQSCFWSELINKSHAVKKDYKGFLRDVDLKRVDISKADYNYMLRRLKSFTSIKDGRMTISDNFAQLKDDDRFSYAFRRMTDYVCNETMQRRGLDDIFIWQIGKGHPFVSLAMQFKTFAIQSYNKRFVKMMNRLEDEGGLAQLNNFMTASALTAATTIAQVQLRSLGMPEEEREKYLRNTIGIGSFKDLEDPENYEKLAFNSFFNRNPIFASVALMANSVGIGTNVKTTASTRFPQQESNWASAPDIGNLIVDMTPAVRLASSIVSGGVGTYNLIRDSITDEDTYRERKNTVRQLMFGLTGLPNIPLITPSLKQYIKEELEDYKYGM